MKAILVRTGSAPGQSPSIPGSPRITLSGSPRVSLNSDHRRCGAPIRRALLEASLSGGLRRSSVAVSRLIPARIAEEEVVGGGKGKGYGGGKKYNSGGGDVNSNKMGEYYEKMLKSYPGDSLLLRNYAKFLQEVEGEMERAEEYYGRAILSSPEGGDDGEVLSLYGKLIWDTHKDEERAMSYFDRAVVASPNDCMVLGSYAHFLWEADPDPMLAAF